MTITESQENDIITLTVSGHVDSITYNDLQNKILTCFQKVNHIYLDMAGVDYISSAGLRAILVGVKTGNAKGGKLICKNVTSAVRNIMEMMGFDQIITIE